MINQPKPASTVCLLRNAGEHLEVFLMRRRMGGTFSGLHVFPGGVVEDADDSIGVDAHQLAQQYVFEGPHGANAYWAAAVRETFEESGVLLAYDASGNFLGGDIGIFAEDRQQLNAKQLNFNEFLMLRGLTPAFDRVTYMTRRVTPIFAPARFDTHFFLSVLPDHAQGTPCNTELEHCFWMTPEQALARSKSDIQMVSPTVKTLEGLLPFNTAEAAYNHFQKKWL